MSPPQVYVVVLCPNLDDHEIVSVHLTLMGAQDLVAARMGRAIIWDYSDSHGSVWSVRRISKSAPHDRNGFYYIAQQELAQ